MKFLQLALIVCCMFLVACKKKEAVHFAVEDFESLSGKNLPAWNYVQTKEDFEQLHFFQRMFDLRKGLIGAAEGSSRIPKVVHFIWIGPRQFPRESVENVRTWMAQHPDWTFYFWTDRHRPLPCPGMKLRRIQEIEFLKLKNCFAKSDGYGEKSDLLRYEILYREGGIYVDHDVKCFKALDPLNKAYDFFCGIDMPYTSSLPACIHPTNNLIGVRPGHPILASCMDMLAEKWDQIEEEYPGTDRDSMLNRVLHRTFWLFGEAVKLMGNQEGNRDIVFPAYYFDAPKDELAIYARHQYAGLWHEKESAFEKMVRQRLMLLSKKSNKMLLFFGAATALNFLVLVAIFFAVRRAMRRS